MTPDGSLEVEKVRGQVPRKQGLKHNCIGSGTTAVAASPRASSTKTRIETKRHGHHLEHRGSPRASSTKTRIETLLWHVPCFVGSGPRASSTKTRIETLTCAVTGLCNDVRGQVPRKQGLKPRSCHGIGKSYVGPRASSTKTRIETLWKSPGHNSP